MSLGTGFIPSCSRILLKKKGGRANVTRSRWQNLTLPGQFPAITGSHAGSIQPKDSEHVYPHTATACRTQHPEQNSPLEYEPHGQRMRTGVLPPGSCSLLMPEAGRD